MFLIFLRNILCPQQMFPSLLAQGNVMSNNVSATMCPRLPPPYCSAARALSESVFSDCQQIVKKICFVVFCAEILQQFSPTLAKRLLTSCVFLSHGETLHCQNKIDKEF